MLLYLKEPHTPPNYLLFLFYLSVCDSRGLSDSSNHEAINAPLHDCMFWLVKAVSPLNSTVPIRPNRIFFFSFANL